MLKFETMNMKLELYETITSNHSLTDEYFHSYYMKKSDDIGSLD